jgi:hypothetical protein
MVARDIFIDVDTTTRFVVRGVGLVYRGDSVPIGMGWEGGRWSIGLVQGSWRSIARDKDSQWRMLWVVSFRLWQLSCISLIGSEGLSGEGGRKDLVKFVGK